MGFDRLHPLYFWDRVAQIYQIQFHLSSYHKWNRLLLLLLLLLLWFMMISSRLLWINIRYFWSEFLEWLWLTISLDFVIIILIIDHILLTMPVLQILILFCCFLFDLFIIIQNIDQLIHLLTTITSCCSSSFSLP